MAEIIATLSEPFTLATIESLNALSVGGLCEPAVIDEVGTGLSPPYLIAGRFPTPPTAFAFFTTVNAFDEDPIVLEGLEPPYVITGALVQEGGFLEPTQGQIWPRIG